MIVSQDFGGVLTANKIIVSQDFGEGIYSKNSQIIYYTNDLIYMRDYLLMKSLVLFNR